MDNRPEPPELLKRNEVWARTIRERDPSYFPNLVADAQAPKNLWIGCSDSRVPETTICACNLGDIFTHRNIANLVHHKDDSVQSVIEYAVGVVGVEHVIVVGHSRCGGVKAAWEASKLPPNLPTPWELPLTRWLTPLVQLSRELGLDREGEQQAVPKLTEESIRQQVRNVVNSDPVKFARRRSDSSHKLWVHGWLFQLEDGNLKVITVDKN